jgi:hypothetical protein
MSSLDSGYGLLLVGAIGAVIGAVTGLFAVVAPGERSAEVFLRGIVGAVIAVASLFVLAALAGDDGCPSGRYRYVANVDRTTDRVCDP